MRTTIDAAGRIVVPKALRDAMGLTAGRQIDVFFTDGRIEIEVAPAEVSVELSEGELPRIVHGDDAPAVTDDMVRDAIEGTRR
jgi:AbrB family looped-hinge helix DNA binding protein